MRVFFLINKFLSNKSSSNSSRNSVLSLNSSLKKKGLVKLRRKNFKKFSSVLVYSGNVKTFSNFSNVKIKSFFSKSRKISQMKFHKLVNKFGFKKFIFNSSSFFNNSLYKDVNYFFLNSKRPSSFFFIKYFKDVFSFQLNDVSNFIYSSYNKYNHFSKGDFYSLNGYSYTLEKSELNFLCNNNLYENDSKDFFFNNINFFNLNSMVLDSNNTALFKEGSYLKQLEVNSSFFNSLFNRRVFFEKKEFFNFFKFKYNFNKIFYKNIGFNYFSFKNKLVPFNYSYDFIYKYLKGRGNRFYISYYNKLNHFFLNLKKNDLLYKRASKKIFLKKYNMLKLYVNDLISGSLNKNLLMGFIFKSGEFFKKDNLNLLFDFSNSHFFFNSLYSNKKQILNFLDFKHTFFYKKFKNYLSFSFHQQLASANLFFNFFISSLSTIKHVPLLSNLLFDVYSIYNYNKMFYIKQILEFSNLNVYSFLFKKNNISGFLNGSFSFSNLSKNYIPFFFDFMFKNNQLQFTDLYNIGFNFKNALFIQKFLIKHNFNFINKNFLAVNEDLFFTNFKYFYIYLNFYNIYNMLLFKEKILPIKGLNLYWLNLIYLK